MREDPMISKVLSFVLPQPDREGHNEHENKKRSYPNRNKHTIKDLLDPKDIIQQFLDNLLWNDRLINQAFRFKSSA